MQAINIEYVKNLHPIFTIPKRIKIIVGGRGSTKSTGIADYVAAKMANGELWCCARENQNSIEESVHRTILDEIDRLNISGFNSTKAHIQHSSGGRAFYRGLARNITSLKSTLSGVHGLWIEEGEDISTNTLRVLTACVRLNAKDSERKIAGEDVPMPEIIITMNRGERTGAVAEKWLKRAETELARCGYYEDDAVMIVQMNYTDMPNAWFLASGLEQERLDDYQHMSRAAYDHKWLGSYYDTVDNAIIRPEWFDACIDAHLIPNIKESFVPRGAVVVSHDPSDEGGDPSSYVCRHGSIIKNTLEFKKGNGNEGCDWATDLAIKDNVDVFIWDCDGMGALLRRQISDSFNGKKITKKEFKGSKSPENPNSQYQEIFGEKRSKNNKDTFLNRRSQYYIKLRDRIFNTYQCVVNGKYSDPDSMISFSSEIELLNKLRSEICRIPLKPNGRGLIQILSKPEMKKLGIDSPNLADGVMMSLVESKPTLDFNIEFTKW